MYMLTRAFTLILLLAVSASALSQQTAKLDNFDITLPAEPVRLKAGETKSLSLTLTRSKKFGNQNIKLRGNHSVSGLTVSCEPGATKEDSFTLKLQASGVAAGQYFVTVTGISPTYTKGRTLTLIVE